MTIDITKIRPGDKVTISVAITGLIAGLVIGQAWTTHRASGVIDLSMKNTADAIAVATECADKLAVYRKAASYALPPR